MSLNKILLIGNCGQAPQIRTVGENKVANFTLATTEKYKDREETEWHNVAVWGRLAEVVEKYVDKGTQLYVEGRIKTEKYTKDGQDKFVTRIIASSLQLLGKKDNQSAPAPAPRERFDPHAVKTTPMPYPTEEEGDDIPFN